MLGWENTEVICSSDLGSNPTQPDKLNRFWRTWVPVISSAHWQFSLPQK